VSDSQDRAEALDDDVLDDRDDAFGDDELDTSYPPDRPQGVGRMAITPAEEAFPESVDERAAREEPDPLAEELDRSAAAEERDAITHHASRVRSETLDEPSGAADDDLRLRLSEVPDSEAWPDAELDEPIELVSLESVEDDEIDEIDEESDLIADAVRPRGTLPAEEAAIHPTGPAPFRGRDSYLTDDDEDGG
jgi:hypothetical protein